eukprot:4926204-Pleurochrysis_carterae.AAC.1
MSSPLACLEMPQDPDQVVFDGCLSDLVRTVKAAEAAGGGTPTPATRTETVGFCASSVEDEAISPGDPSMLSPPIEARIPVQRVSLGVPPRSFDDPHAVHRTRSRVDPCCHATGSAMGPSSMQSGQFASAQEHEQVAQSAGFGCAAPLGPGCQLQRGGCRALSSSHVRRAFSWWNTLCAATTNQPECVWTTCFRSTIAILPRHKPRVLLWAYVHVGARLPSRLSALGLADERVLWTLNQVK